MFGFGKRKSEPPPKTGRRSSDGNREQAKAQLNIFGIGDDPDLEVDDADLEDELLALLGEGGGGGKKTKSPQRRAPGASAAAAPTSSRKPVVDPFAIPDFKDEGDDDIGDDDDDDIDESELEAELGILTGGDANENDFKPPEDTGELMQFTPEPPPRAAAANVPAVSKESMVQMLQERLEMYEKAKQKVDAVGDTGKSRRFTRAIKTLKELVAKAKAGKAIDENDIPPVVSVADPKPKVESQSEEPKLPVVAPAEEMPIPVFEPIPQVPPPVPRRPAPLPEAPPQLPPVQVPAAVVEKPPMDPAVEARIKDYKKAAVILKKSGDIQGGLKYFKLAKALEAAANSGEPVNLSDFPPIPEASEAPKPQQVEEALSGAPPAPSTQDEQGPSEPPPPPPELFAAPPPPTTVMEALEQRLDKYKSEMEKAKAENNSSKARRLGRIVKQYEEAIMLYKKGKNVPFDELPTPPGFGPIPVPGSSGASVSAAGGAPVTPATPAPASAPAAVPPTTPSAESPSKRPPPPAPTASPGTAGPSKSPASGQGSINRAGKPPGAKLTLQEKQLYAVLQRQRQFKEAAVAAKKRGDLDQAREFLRTAKGFDNLIQASQAGLPVDMNTLPCAPDAVEELEAENFELVSGDDCFVPEGGAAEVFAKLEEDLKNQLKMCMRTRDHYKSIGDVGSANKFERLALESKRDLDTLRLAARQGGSLPKYHYETRIFSITECNTDLNDDEIEISVIKGINYKVSNPSDVDTFVKVELPFPTPEEVQINKTAVVRDTNNPEYNEKFKMSINRTKKFQRFVQRHGVKLEVWSKGGFLRSSTLIGTATAKLSGLESKCTVHEAFDILEGRKSVGKLEVKLRLRDPVLAKQITQKKEKWLSIDRA